MIVYVTINKEPYNDSSHQNYEIIQMEFVSTQFPSWDTFLDAFMSSIEVPMYAGHLLDCLSLSEYLINIYSSIWAETFRSKE